MEKKKDAHEIQNELLKFIVDKNELYDIKYGTLSHTIRQTLLQCIMCAVDNEVRQFEYLFGIESVIDYLNDELNTGHWSNVALHKRHYFTIASFTKCLILLREYYDEDMFEVLKECLRCLDFGLILGAPLENNSQVLTDSAKFLRKELIKYHTPLNKTEIEKLNSRNEEPCGFLKLNGSIVDSVECPSLEYFNKKYFTPQIPVKIKGCMSHWPASSKWTDINYILEVAGDRTVPVEIGSHYADENWTQKLMTIRDFITTYYLPNTEKIAYLAQHNLFEQIVELKDDICIPEYCCLSLDYEKTVEPDVNAWFGPKGTLSPLHTDPKNNLLAQVYGRKQVILFSPQDTSYLYPHEETLLNNTAQINPVQPDLERFPDFAKAKMFKCLLEPGEMLFIPVQWWHHVTSLDRSFSVSFWWQ